MTNFDASDIASIVASGSNPAVVLGTMSGSGATYSITAQHRAGSTLTISLGNSYTDLVGNVGTSGPATGLAPAGISGEFINLALSNPAADQGDVTITFADLPSDWTLNAGARNSDGFWTAHTSDPSSLFVTTPGGFTGAAVLDVTMSWTNADGTAAMMFVADNVEAYAPRSLPGPATIR